ncbi:MAG: hypothetical protein COB15_06360 [Flavobacteriales bacterium]|nr:MAG: hypothetical protein COB15_06360 [Flavobacteriales bacterium]
MKTNIIGLFIIVFLISSSSLFGQLHINGPGHSSGVHLYDDINEIIAPSNPSGTLIGIVNDGSAEVEYKSGKHIQLKDLFHAGTFSGTGNFHAHIDMEDILTWIEPTPVPFPLAIDKYAKLELGITLPADVNTRVAGFFTDVESPMTSGSYRYEDRATIGLANLNPFDKNDVDVQVKFTNTNSGTEKIVNAFYYNDWDYTTLLDPSDGKGEVTTTIPWRVRFAPPEIGNWKVDVFIKIREENATTHDVLRYFSPNKGDFEFQCNTGGDFMTNKGPISFGQNDKYLTYNDNGEMLFPVGFTVGPNNDYGSISDISPEEHSFMHEYIKRLKEQGGNVLRVYISPNYLYGWKKLGVYDDGSNPEIGGNGALFEIDQLVELAEEQDIYLYFLLQNGSISASEIDKDGNLNTGGEEMYWDKLDPSGGYVNPYREILDDLYGLGEPEQAFEQYIGYFLDEDIRDEHKNRLRYLMSRISYSPHVYALNLHNEIDGFGPGRLRKNAYTVSNPAYDNKCNNYPSTLFNGQTIPEAASEWIDEMSTYLKEEIKVNQMLTVSTGWGACDCHNKAPNIDFIDVHEYGDDRIANLVQRPLEIKSAKTGFFANSCGPIDKPIFMGETGSWENRPIVDRFHPITFHNSLWSTSFMGLFGSGLHFYGAQIVGIPDANPEPNWPYTPFFDPGGHDQHDYSGHFDPLTQFMHTVAFTNNSIDLNNDFETQIFPHSNDYPNYNAGTYSQSSTPGTTNDNPILEAFTLVSGNEAIGWVHNRTAFWGNLENYGNFLNYTGTPNVDFFDTEPGGEFKYKSCISTSPDVEDASYSIIDDSNEPTGEYLGCNDDDTDAIIPITDNTQYFVVKGLDDGFYDVAFYYTLTTSLNVEKVLTRTYVQSLGQSMKVFAPEFSSGNVPYYVSTGRGSGYTIENDHDYAFIIKPTGTIARLGSFNEDKDKETLKETSSQIKVVPNPNKGVFNLYLDDSFEGKVIVEVLNTIGAVIFNKTVYNTKSLKLDIENQPMGIYFLKVTSGNNVKVERIIKN